ncbi:hypothetical protein B0H11DRAFT_1942758 [Mycena galericulata]|nr:hypothetical protein B0H11DRAFT_1942758 [Mycena galericulata]
MSRTLNHKSWSPDTQIFTRVILGLVTPGFGLTVVLLALFSYAAWNPGSRRYVDRVSFRLLTYALIAQLVLALRANGQKIEKYYVLGIAFTCLIVNLAPYASGNLGAVLREVSNQISIPDILGTEKGIQALAKFLESSGAFTKTGQPRRETEPLPPEDEEDDRESDAGSEGGYGGDEESGDEGHPILVYPSYSPASSADTRRRLDTLNDTDKFTQPDLIYCTGILATRAFRQMGRSQRDMLVPQHGPRGYAALAFRHTDLLDPTFCRGGGRGFSSHRWLSTFIHARNTVLARGQPDPGHRFIRLGGVTPPRFKDPDVSQYHPTRRPVPNRLMRAQHFRGRDRLVRVPKLREDSVPRVCGTQLETEPCCMPVWTTYLNPDLAIYSGRPLIYGLLAATDPSFIRALRALRHHEDESTTQSHDLGRSALCLSTVIDIQPEGDLLRSHAIENFRGKGTSRNMNTRVGEGFQQEVTAQYKKTNGKNAEHQMSIMDENEETMARIQMAVDEWLKSQEENEKESVLGPSNSASSAPSHWKLGSADPRVTTVRIEAHNQHNPSFRAFNSMLRESGYTGIFDLVFLGLKLRRGLQIEPCKVLYVDYQSKVDWKPARDILRCNPCFHTRSRYDSIIYEAQDDDAAMGQLELVFRCHLPKKITLDLALIRPYRESTWVPRTRTDCPIREWRRKRRHCARTCYAWRPVVPHIRSIARATRAKAVPSRLKPENNLRHFECLGTGYKPPASGFKPVSIPLKPPSRLNPFQLIWGFSDIRGTDEGDFHHPHAGHNPRGGEGAASGRRSEWDDGERTGADSATANCGRVSHLI